MTSVINRRSQFEEGVIELKGEIDALKKQIEEKDAEVTRLTTELNSQKETFEEASTAVKEHKALKDNQKVLTDNLNAVTLERNTLQKELDELRVKLSSAEKKAKRSAHKLKKASKEAKAEHSEFLEGWKRSPEGLDFLGQMASRSYRMAVRETKERLKGILVGPDSSLDWSRVEAEFDARIAEEQRVNAEKAAKKDPPQSSASKAPQPSVSKVSEDPTDLPSTPPEAPTPKPEVDVEPEDLLSESSNDEDGTGSTDSSPTKTVAV